MLPTHTNSPIFTLLTGQACTRPVKALIRITACARSKNSPRSRGNLKGPSRVCGKSPVRQPSKEKGRLCDLPER